MAETVGAEPTKGWYKAENPEATLSEIKIILAKWNSVAWMWELWLLILGIVGVSSSLFISAFANPNLWQPANFYR